MHNIALLDECFNEYLKNINNWAPDLLIQVDLSLLHQFGLLHFHPKTEDPSLTRYFHVIESAEKITLVNDEFVVWIVPEKFHEIQLTYVLIALNHPEKLHLELGFVTSGVYNTSRMVLRILEKFLHEIQENEEMLNKIKKTNN